MVTASLRFWCDCIAEALLEHYQVRHLPVPVRRMLEAPPPDLAHDLSLTEALSYGDAVWVRPWGGQASVFVNPEAPEPQRRFAMARAMFLGLCHTRGGRAAGLPGIPNDQFKAQGDLFARRLLMPPSLLPGDWQRLPAAELATLCNVPVEVAEAHLDEARRQTAGQVHDLAQE